MCRLLGWVAQPGITLRAALGDAKYAAFTALARTHADGWGLAYGTDGELAIRKSPHAASADPEFAALSTYAVTEAAIAHLRWATPGLPVEQRNTHPFRYGASAFAHNGGIYPLDRLPELLTPPWRSRLQGTTDSEHYYLALVSEVEDCGADLPAAINRVTCRLASDYAPSSLNAMLLTPEALYAVSCYDPAMRPELPVPRVSASDPSGPVQESAETYYDLRYRRRNGAVVVASSGFPQPSDAGWQGLPNNSVLVVDRRTADLELVLLDARLHATTSTARPR